MGRQIRFRDPGTIIMVQRRSRFVGKFRLPWIGVCRVHVEDGKALIFHKRSIALVDWFQWCRFRRRHKLEAIS